MAARQRGDVTLLGVDFGGVAEEIGGGREFDDIIGALAESNLPTRHAVCLTLITRHMKRINAHLGNIASSVVMPLHKIDYFDEKWK